MAQYRDIKQDIVAAGYEGSGIRKGKAPTRKKLEKMLAAEALVDLKKLEDYEGSVAQIQDLSAARQEGMKGVKRAVMSPEATEVALAGLGGDPAATSAVARNIGTGAQGAIAQKALTAGEAAQQGVLTAVARRKADLITKMGGDPGLSFAERMGQGMAQQGIEAGIGVGEDYLRGNVLGLEEAHSRRDV